MKFMLSVLALSAFVGSSFADQVSCRSTRGGISVIVRDHNVQETRVPSVFVISDTNRDDGDHTLIAAKDSRKELEGNLKKLTIKMEQALKDSESVKNQNLVLFNHRLSSYQSITLELPDFAFGQKDASAKNPYKGTLSGVMNDGTKVKGVNVRCDYATKEQLEEEKKQASSQS